MPSARSSLESRQSVSKQRRLDWLGSAMSLFGWRAEMELERIVVDLI
jgi:hypothetical protein